MKKIWTAYDEHVKKMVKLVDPEVVDMANGQKAMLGESSESGKLIYRMVSYEEAKKWKENH